jgi:hypothetical protein
MYFLNALHIFIFYTNTLFFQFICLCALFPFVNRFSSLLYFHRAIFKFFPVYTYFTTLSFCLSISRSVVKLCYYICLCVFFLFIHLSVDFLPAFLSLCALSFCLFICRSMLSNCHLVCMFSFSLYICLSVCVGFPLLTRTKIFVVSPSFSFPRHCEKEPKNYSFAVSTFSNFLFFWKKLSFFTFK